MAVVKRRISIPQRRQQLLDAIEDYIKLNDIAPSVRDLADATGYRVFSVHQHLKVLEAEGYLTMKPKLARSIQLTGKGKYHQEA